MLEIDLQKITTDGVPYEKFLDGIKDPGTKRHYVKNLERFLREVPQELYEQLGCAVPDGTLESSAECFVKLCEKNPKAGTNIIAEYIKHFNGLVRQGEISPNTVPNYPKPIKVLLDTNDVAIHWKRLYHLYPRPVNSQDRAYTREELQKMMIAAHDITDKVIITMFSSAGFRLESWSYFTWRDVIFFRDEEEQFKGGALLVYCGDPESYWTFITPEACEYLWQYREKWRNDLHSYPEPDFPLLRVTDRLEVRRLEQKGVRKRVENMAKDAGLRPPLPPGKKRYSVKLDHGFRKYFNTMMRRAKVNYLDKEDMMGHKVGLEKNYERYVEEDFERFSEYQKAIAFLTISDEQRLKKEAKDAQEKIRQAKVIQSSENAKLMQEVSEFKDLAKKIQDTGIMEILKNISACDICSSSYVGEHCPKCE